MIQYFVDFADREGARLLRRSGLPPGALAQTSKPQAILARFESLIRNGLRSTPSSLYRASLVLARRVYPLERGRTTEY